VIENWGGKMQDVLVEEYGQDFFVESWQTWMDILLRLQRNKGGEFCSKALHKITCPTYILHGAKDRIVSPKHAKYLHENIKNSKYAHLP
jgi:pimeloyl-ACP methyl ester carboxylesterase